MQFLGGLELIIRRRRRFRLAAVRQVEARDRGRQLPERELVDLARRKSYGAAEAVDSGAEEAAVVCKDSWPVAASPACVFPKGSPGTPTR